MSMDDDGGVMMMWSSGGSSDGEPYVDTQNGYIKNTNVGIQYSNKWKEKQTLNFSPKFNSQIYNNARNSFTQMQLGDSAINTTEATTTNVNRYNFKSSLTYDVKIDSNNSIKFTAKANFYHTESEEMTDATTTDGKNAVTNIRSNSSQNNSDKQSLYASVLFKHKFAKPRRTFSLNTDWNNLGTDGTNFSKQNINDIYNGVLKDIDQKKLADKQTQTLSARIVYTEPLSKKYSMELSHELSFNNGKNDQTTYSYSTSSGKYDFMVDSLTNNFKQSIIVNKPAFSISYSDKKIKFNFGSGFGLTHFNLDDQTMHKEYIRNYTNFFPAATFTYSYKANHSVRFNYNGNTTQPTLNQLQPLRDNSDYFNQYIGNPNLKPSFSNNLSVSHNSYNFLKDLWSYQSVNISTVSNSITNNRTIFPGGRTITQPINTDGNFSASFWSNLGAKIKKFDMRYSAGPNFNYNKYADVINGKTSYSRTLSTSLELYLSKSKDKKYDLSVSNNFSWNRNTTSQSATVNKYYTNTTSFSATVYYKKVWSVISNYDLFLRQKTVQFNTNLTTNIWNARLNRTFKKDEFTAYILVRDILNQNLSVERFFDGNTTSEIRNERLQRYFMVGFTWNFKNKAAAPAAPKTK
jgi:hypothetical protein